MIRYNTNNNRFEVHENGTWLNMTPTGSGDNLGNHTATQAILALNGTASLPSYSFAGDIDTGIYKPGTDQLAFAVGGNEGIRIDNWGYVGIGTTTPVRPLDIAEDINYASGAIVRNTNSGVDAEAMVAAMNDVDDMSAIGVHSSGKSYNAIGLGEAYQYATTNLVLMTDNPGTVIKFATASTERVRIDSVGRLGVGSTTPAAMLHVVGTGGLPAAFYLENGDASIVNGNSVGSIDFRGRATGSRSGARIVATAKSTWGTPLTSATDLTFHTQDLAGGDSLANPRMIIDSSGKIGIANSNPTWTLDVVGSANISGDVSVRRLAGTSSTPTVSCATATEPAAGATTSGSCQLYRGSSANGVVGGSDLAHTLMLTVGTGPSSASNSVAATVSFSSPFPSPPTCIFKAGNATAALLETDNTKNVYIQTFAGGYQLRKIGAGNLLAGGTYEWHVHCIQ
jgi:hypothetical protein